MTDTKARIVLAAEDRTARVFAGLKSNLGAVRTQVDATNQSFIGLSPAILGAFSVVGIGAFFGKVVDGIDKLNDLADATGSSVENLSGLEDIGARTGTSIDTIGSAILKLNKNLLDARDPASEAAQLFKALGLNAEELSKADPSDALLRVSTALNGFASNADKGQFQLALLGKSTRELAPFLKDLAEAGKINSTVTTEQAAAAEEYNKQLFGLQKNVTDASRALVAELLPSLKSITGELSVGLKAYKSFSDALLDIGINVDPFKDLGAQITETTKRITTLEKEAGRVANGEGFNNFFLTDAQKQFRLQTIQQEIDLLKKRREFLQDSLPPEFSNEGRSRPAPDRPSLVVPIKPDKAAKTPKDRLTDAQQYLENLQRQLQGTQDLSVAETVLADIQAGRLKLAKGESAAPLVAIAEQIDQAKRRTDQLKAEAEQVSQLRAENERLVADGRAVFEATRTPREQLTRDIEQLQDLLKKGAIDTDTYYRRVQQLDDAFDELGQAKETVEELDSFTVRAAQNIQDVLGEELSSVLDGNFKSIGQNFKRTLNRMVAEALAADLTGALFGGSAKGSGKVGGGILGSLIDIGSSFLGGGGYNGSSGINGGSVIRPSSLRGGAATGTNLLERDMITLVHKGEAIVPKAFNPSAFGGGQPVNVVNNFTINGPIDRRSQSAVAEAAGAGAQRALSRRGIR